MPIAFSSPSSRSRRARSAAASRSVNALPTVRATSGRPAPAATRPYQAGGHGPGARGSTTPITRVRSTVAGRAGFDVRTTLSDASGAVHGCTSNSSASSEAAAAAAGEPGS